MTRPTAVLLADDHALVLRMLRDRLDAEQDLTVVAAVGSAAEAVGEALRWKPDVVVMDIDMPGMICFEAARTIRETCPQTRTVFLSAFSNDTYIEQALSVEAAGYLTKSEPPEAVIRAVRAIRAGQRCFSADVEARIILAPNGLQLAPRGQARAYSLSNRELEILRYVARGLSRKEIAQITKRSVKTVKAHCANIMKKLHIHDRVELARFAIREGLADA